MPIYVCSLCDVEFNQLGHYKRHINRKFKCNEPRKYTSPRFLISQLTDKQLTDNEQNQITDNKPIQLTDNSLTDNPLTDNKPIQLTDTPLTDNKPIQLTTNKPIQLTDSQLTDNKPIPLTDKPLTDKPLTDKPLTDKSLTDKPLTDNKPIQLTDKQLTDNKPIQLTDKPKIIETKKECSDNNMQIVSHKSVSQKHPSSECFNLNNKTKIAEPIQECSIVSHKPVTEKHVSSACLNLNDEPDISFLLAQSLKNEQKEAQKQEHLRLQNEKEQERIRLVRAEKEQAFIKLQNEKEQERIRLEHNKKKDVKHIQIKEYSNDDLLHTDETHVTNDFTTAVMYMNKITKQKPKTAKRLIGGRTNHKTDIMNKLINLKNDVIKGGRKRHRTLKINVIKS